MPYKFSNLISACNVACIFMYCSCIKTYVMDYQLKLQSPWEEVKELIKEVNHELTDEDLAYTPGQEKQLLERLSKKMNKDPESVKGWIESVSGNKRVAS
jgi:GTP cyclohydrolase I